jgi:hypothetical protein
MTIPPAVAYPMRLEYPGTEMFLGAVPPLDEEEEEALALLCEEFDVTR